MRSKWASVRAQLAPIGIYYTLWLTQLAPIGIYYTLGLTLEFKIQ
jgi:hypothetical protein